MTYYDRIRELREDNDFTQKQIASIINVAQRTYSDYETGRIRIPVDILLELARYYDLSMDYVSGASNVKKPFPAK